MFKTHALGLHSQIMKGDHNDNWTNLMTTHNAFHQDLAQSGDCEEGGGSADPDAKIQALIAQTVEEALGTPKLSKTRSNQSCDLIARSASMPLKAEGCHSIEVAVLVALF